MENLNCDNFYVIFKNVKFRKIQKVLILQNYRLLNLELYIIFFLLAKVNYHHQSSKHIRLFSSHVISKV